MRQKFNEEKKKNFVWKFEKWEVATMTVLLFTYGSNDVPLTS